MSGAKREERDNDTASLVLAARRAHWNSGGSRAVNSAVGRLRADACALDVTSKLHPPAPTPRSLKAMALLRVLLDNPIEVWAAAHFEQPVVVSDLSIGRVTVVSDPAAGDS